MLQWGHDRSAGENSRKQSIIWRARGRAFKLCIYMISKFPGRVSVIVIVALLPGHSTWQHEFARALTCYIFRLFTWTTKPPSLARRAPDFGKCTRISRIGRFADLLGKIECQCAFRARSSYHAAKRLRFPWSEGSTQKETAKEKTKKAWREVHSRL